MATKPRSPSATQPSVEIADELIEVPKFGLTDTTKRLITEELFDGTPIPQASNRLPRTLAPRTLAARKERAQLPRTQEDHEERSELDRKVLQEVLPFWDDNSRGVPNPFIRSGIFSVKTGVSREYLDNIRIDSLSNYQVRYEGKELQQDDLTVWMALINLARNQPIADKIFFSGYELIKDMGWRMHSETYEKVKQSIQRLKVTAIQIATSNGAAAYSGSLIRAFGWNEMDPQSGNAKWMVRFEPSVSSLFMEDTTTLLEWQTRKAIGTRATVALWLHAFYSSHRDPIPLPLSKLYELSRSGASLSTFRRNVKNALQTLKEVGFLTDFDVKKGDIVYVTKRLKAKALANQNALLS